MDISLLAASIVTPPFRSLVPASRFELAAPAIARSETGHPSDDIVWSAPVRNDASFDFAALLNFDRGSDQASSQWSSSSSARASRSGGYTQNAASHYSMNAGSPASIYGHLVNVYA
jgi:hypothetical protein